MKRLLAGAALCVSLASTAVAATSAWTVDPKNSAVQFNVRHLGISNVQGAFTKISGTVNLDDADITKSSVTASIDMSSVDTRVDARDSDLRSDKFLNVAQFPTMTFQSTKIEKSGDGLVKMTGNLTLHGVTKQVAFDVTGPTPPINQSGVMRRGAEATATIDRRDFGITADPGIVGNEIQITLDVEITQPGTGGAPAPGTRGPAAPAASH
jgi:polyisoprenoid-binding protein YceI